jgi:hypothetical protein
MFHWSPCSLDVQGGVTAPPHTAYPWVPQENVLLNLRCVQRVQKSTWQQSPSSLYIPFNCNQYTFGKDLLLLLIKRSLLSVGVYTKNIVMADFKRCILRAVVVYSKREMFVILRIIQSVCVCVVFFLMLSCLIFCVIFTQQ